MLSFSGWNFFSNTASILNGQGVNLLINLFFGVVLNAARGISAQVESAVMSFVSNFSSAINPQITKSSMRKKIMIDYIFWFVKVPNLLIIYLFSFLYQYYMKQNFY